MTRARFAPSPTGQLHVGGARSALFNVLFARATGGKMVLRIEDTDRARSSRASEDGICADLRWLGLDWDEGPGVGGPGAPYRQSERLERYQAHLQDLLDAGHLYEAWETTDELGAMRRAAESAGGSLRYRRRTYGAEELADYRAQGRVPVLRLQVPREPVTIHDDVLGDVVVPADDLDDFVVRKQDGFPTYHFAVVVDDHHMQVTHVLRAQEHLMNTARHLLLYRAFGWEAPRHGHMPLIFSMSGGKMSKRDKAKAARAALRESGRDPAQVGAAIGLDAHTMTRFKKKKLDDVAVAQAVADELGVTLPEIDVVDFRRAGYLPEALVNFLALLGWSPGDDRELMAFDELVQAFTVDRIGRTAARFDRDKLRWMNGVYIRQTPDDVLLTRLRAWLDEVDHPVGAADDALLSDLIPLFKERSATLLELADKARFFFEAPTAYGPPKAIEKHLLKGDGLARLGRVNQVLAACDDWSEAGLETALRALVDAEYGGNLGKVAQPIRIALTGTPVSPPIFSTVAQLGRDETLARLQACLDHFLDAGQ